MFLLHTVKIGINFGVIRLQIFMQIDIFRNTIKELEAKHTFVSTSKCIIITK